jgi:hypothetical protein
LLYSHFIRSRLTLKATENKWLLRRKELSLEMLKAYLGSILQQLDNSRTLSFQIAAIPVNRAILIIVKMLKISGIATNHDRDFEALFRNLFRFLSHSYQVFAWNALFYWCLVKLELVKGIEPSFRRIPFYSSAIL